MHKWIVESEDQSEFHLVVGVKRKAGTSPYIEPELDELVPYFQLELKVSGEVETILYELDRAVQSLKFAVEKGKNV